MELKEVTPEDSIAPVYLEILTSDEEAKRDEDRSRLQAESEAREAERIALDQARESGRQKLLDLGLTEVEVKAMFNV